MSTVKLNKWGNSQGIRITKKILNEIGAEKDSTFKITVKNGSIILTPIITRNKLDTLFKNFKEDPSEYTENIDWGKPTGNEKI